MDHAIFLYYKHFFVIFLTKSFICLLTQPWLKCGSVLIPWKTWNFCTSWSNISLSPSSLWSLEWKSFNTSELANLWKKCGRNCSNQHPSGTLRMETLGQSQWSDNLFSTATDLIYLILCCFQHMLIFWTINIWLKRSGRLIIEKDIKSCNQITNHNGLWHL